MSKIEDSVEILSPPEMVWNVLSDPTYIPKLYRDAVTVELDPPGHTALGQRCKILIREGGLRIPIFVEVIRVEKERFLETRGLPGGLFASFRHLVTLKALGLGATEVRITFEYLVAPEYAAKTKDPAGLERSLKANFMSYAMNLKDLSELIPLAE
jgi:hypothetical protein